MNIIRLIIQIISELKILQSIITVILIQIKLYFICDRISSITVPNNIFIMTLRHCVVDFRCKGCIIINSLISFGIYVCFIFYLIIIQTNIILQFDIICKRADLTCRHITNFPDHTSRCSSNIYRSWRWNRIG